MRATGKYTQRTLNKVIENLPPLYLDLTNCRQGGAGHGIDDFQIEVFEKFILFCGFKITTTCFHFQELEPFNETADALQEGLLSNPHFVKHHHKPQHIFGPHLRHLSDINATAAAANAAAVSGMDNASSIYFTPSGTPIREVEGIEASNEVKTSSLKSSPARDSVNISKMNFQ